MYLSMVVLRMAVDIIGSIDREFKDVSRKIRDDEQHWPYFKDCIEAIDGTHALLSISPSKQIPYIDRKMIVTHNVMAL
jgi:hypothetical protein